MGNKCLSIFSLLASMILITQKTTVESQHNQCKNFIVTYINDVYGYVSVNGFFPIKVCFSLIYSTYKHNRFHPKGTLVVPQI